MIFLLYEKLNERDKLHDEEIHLHAINMNSSLVNISKKKQNFKKELLWPNKKQINTWI